MLPLATRIQGETLDTERRRARRHGVAMRLEGLSRAVVENLSETGLALRTDAPLRAGDSFEIELPLAGTVTARVTWSEAEIFGCELLEPISNAAVSAARLQSPFEARGDAVAIDDTPIAMAGGAIAPAPRYGLAAGVMVAFATVAAMFIAAMLTAPFAVY